MAQPEQREESTNREARVEEGRPFHQSLLINLSAGVLLLGGCLLILSLRATADAVERLSGSLTKSVIATTDAQLMRFFEPVLSTMAVSAERTLGGEFEDFPQESLDNYFVPIVERIPQLSSLMYAHENGDEYMLLKSGGAWQSRQTRPATWGPWEDWREWLPDADERPVQRREVDYDARRRPWFIGAIERLHTLGEGAPLRNRIHWTAPYKFFTTKEPGVTASVAHRIASGRVVVLGFDILLSDISKFTSQLEIGRRGKVFVLRGPPHEPAGLVVVGLPADERFDDPEVLIQFVLSPPYDLGGPVASFVTRALGEGEADVGDAVRFEHEGERWWGSLARSNLDTSDDLWVGSVVPEEELLAGLPNTNLIVIVTTGAIVLLAVVRSFRLARRYSEPLEGLSEGGNRMQRLNFEPVEPVESDITEIRQLSSTLERMRQALQTFSSEREDLRIARSIRAMTLPKDLPEVSGFELRAWHEPAQEVGGEEYDAVSLPGPVEDAPAAAAVLACFDALGSGVGATVQGSQLRAAFRSGVRAGSGLSELAASLDGFVRDDLPGAAPVRAWLLRLDAGSSTLRALGLGQEALVHHHDERVERVAATGPPLGVARDGPLPEPVELVLSPGATVVLASDGVLDALDAERRRYGLEGVERALRELDGGAPDDLIARVRRDLERHATGPRRDRTVLVIRATG